jgi:hypothetical protein
VSVITGVDGCGDSERDCKVGPSPDELDSDVDESRVVAWVPSDAEMRSARRKRSLSAMISVVRAGVLERWWGAMSIAFRSLSSSVGASESEFNVSPAGFRVLSVR